MPVDRNWDMIIRPKTGWFNINLKELWSYKDLLYMFVKRDIITIYKQTILGPLWFVIQPILTTAIYILVFANIAGISTNGQPQILFYLAGIIIWNYFSESFNTTSKTFTENANVFGKVYFPRLVVPVSKVFSGLIKFLIQFCFFIAIYFYYLFFTESTIDPNMVLAVLPLLVMTMAFLGLGFGIIFSALTTKYRDLTFLIQFGVQLLMYATPVIYPVSTIPEKYKWIIMANPMTPVVEGFRYAFLGGPEFFNWSSLIYSVIFTLITLFLGIVIFNRVEKNFMDTV